MADGPFVVVTDEIPGMCMAIRATLFWRSHYLTPDPVQELAADENTNYLNMAGGGFTALFWQRLTVADFHKRAPDKFAAMSDAGEKYDHSYAVYVTPDSRSVDFYGESLPRRVYSLVYHRSARLPEIMILEDDGPAPALAEGLKSLGASDVVGYGPRAYPIVRKPGEMLVYEIDTDLPGKQTMAEKKFIPKVVCDIVEATAAAAAATSAPAAPAEAQTPLPPQAATAQTPDAATPQQPAPPPPITPSAASPVTAPSPVAAAVAPVVISQPTVSISPPTPPADPCAQFQAANPAFYANCERRMKLNK